MDTTHMGVTRILTASLVLAAAVFGAAFVAPDTIAVHAVASFDALLDAPGPTVARSDDAATWVLTAPGGEKFVFGGNSATGSNEVVVTVDALPFLKAGLDVFRLPAGMLVEENGTTVTLVMQHDIGPGSFSDAAALQPVKALQDLVDNHRTMVGYHAALGHFGLALGEGNMVEWAQDQQANDKDLVFVLNPQPLADAGVDVADVQGWVLADVPMMDAQGRQSTARKLLKFYNLK